MLVAKKERFDSYDLPQVRSKELPRLRRIRKIDRPTKVCYCCVAILTLALSFLLTARYAQIHSIGYELVALKKQQQILNMENQALQSRVDQLKSLDNIEYIATVKLGMQKPETAEGVQFVPVEYSKTGSNETARAASAEDSVQDSAPKQKKNSLVQALVGIING